MPYLGGRRNALRFSALRVLTAHRQSAGAAFIRARMVAARERI
jgi:hypothetical protein